MAEWIVGVELIRGKEGNVKTEQRVCANNGTGDKSVAFRAVMSFIENNVLHIFFNDLERNVEIDRETRDEAVGRLYKIANKARRGSMNVSDFRLQILREMNVHIHSIKQVR